MGRESAFKIKNIDRLCVQKVHTYASVCFSTRTVAFIFYHRQSAQEPVSQAVEVACCDLVTYAEEVLHFSVEEGLKDGPHDGHVALHARPVCQRSRRTEENGLANW